MLRWPEPDQVMRQVTTWAEQQGSQTPSLERVAVFGSYGRGTAGVGSDLDLLLIDAGASGPQHRRLLNWPLALLPLSCDALVLTPEEHDALMAAGSRFAMELGRDARWLWSRRAAEHPAFSGPLRSPMQDRCG
ncbi:nucleotidyltransferase domain-containing protein [Cyanobium sp. N5-Cardenillas]|nr:nucleotidyltransferase domain-containing protein [Cyanobium sp. N5-Cardenillas]